MKRHVFIVVIVGLGLWLSRHMDCMAENYVVTPKSAFELGSLASALKARLPTLTTCNDTNGTVSCQVEGTLTALQKAELDQIVDTYAHDTEMLKQHQQDIGDSVKRKLATLGLSDEEITFVLRR